MTRADFALYDVVDTIGPTAGLKNNPWPLTLREAEEVIARHDGHGVPEIVRTADRAWEDYCWQQQYGQEEVSKK